MSVQLLKNRIIVSQPPPGETGKSPYTELAEKFHLEVDFRPFIRIEGVSVRQFRQYKIDILEHDAVFLSSKTAADHYFRICEETRVTVPDSMKFFCTSESIANYLQKYIVYRKRKIFFGTTMDELVTIILKHKPEKMLLPLSDSRKQEVPRLLDKKSLAYTKVILYRVEYCDLSDVNITDYGILAFYSPTEIKSLLQNFPDFEQGEIKIACYGPATIRAARAAHLRVDIQAPRPQVPSLTMAIERHLKGLVKA